MISYNFNRNLVFPLDDHFFIFITYLCLEIIPLGGPLFAQRPIFSNFPSYNNFSKALLLWIGPNRAKCWQNF